MRKDNSLRKAELDLLKNCIVADEFGETAKRLVVRVALELRHRRFVAEIFQLLENQQPDYQLYGLGGSAQALAIMFGKGLIQLAPGNYAGKAEQRIIGIELLQQIGAE